MKLRRAAVHKAQPIKHYKPMEVNFFKLILVETNTKYFIIFEGEAKH